MKKIICLLLAVLTGMGLCSCAFVNIPGNMTEPSANAGTSQIGNPPVSPETYLPTEADIEFEKLDREIFISIVTSDGLSYHQYVINPASFDIDEADVERGWGDFSYEATEEGFLENREMLEKLNAIDRGRLSEMNRFAYDNIRECLILSNELEDYYYYKEPLTTLNGAHTTIPLMLILYEINSKADIENYLYLLEDSERYFKQIEQFEREKAERGLFMSENALEQVAASCREFVKQGEECFLITHFEEVLKNTGFELSDAEKEIYKRRNKTFILERLLPGYTSLINTLEALKGNCGQFAGAAAKSDEAKAYFCKALRNAAAFNMECDVMADILKASCKKTYSKLNSLTLLHITEISDYGNNVTTGSVETDIEYLKSLLPPVYPPIPEQQITYAAVPDAIADDFSPAAYLISAFDNPVRNVVLLNPHSENTDMLFTLSHECFPGHLYQTQYFRNMKRLSLTQQAIAPTGYLEGWAVFSEVFMPSMFKEYGTGICQIKQLNSVLCNILIPGYVSLQVNAFNWTKDDIRNYIGSFGLNNEDYVNIIYEYAVNMPLYFFDYAMGYTYTAMLYESAKPKSNAEKLTFFTEYLNCGPCYYDILFEKFKIEY